MILTYSFRTYTTFTEDYSADSSYIEAFSTFSAISKDIADIY